MVDSVRSTELRRPSLPTFLLLQKVFCCRTTMTGAVAVSSDGDLCVQHHNKSKFGIIIDRGGQNLPPRGVSAQPTLLSLSLCLSLTSSPSLTLSSHVLQNYLILQAQSLSLFFFWSLYLLLSLALCSCEHVSLSFGHPSLAQQHCITHVTTYIKPWTHRADINSLFCLSVFKTQLLSLLLSLFDRTFISYLVHFYISLSSLFILPPASPSTPNRYIHKITQLPSSSLSLSLFIHTKT